MGLLRDMCCFYKSNISRETNPSNPTLTSTKQLFSNQRLVSTKQPSSVIKELCHHFSLAELQSSTNNFNHSSIIGEGGFGVVYKGHLKQSSAAVAIKRCKKESFFGFSEFKNEVVLLSQIHHPNLMPLVGFCVERNELVLVYEYMSNGSLSDHIHLNKIIRDPLPWKLRLKICIGVARGLHYLHTGLKYAIIHRHIKSRNIVLDHNWEPKISGLFLSKRGPYSMSKSLIRVNSRVMSTCGYSDPEYAATGDLTEKSDVYLFGIVLLEVFSAMSPMDLIKEHLKRKYLLKSYAEEIVDPFLKSKIDPSCWNLFVDIAHRCLVVDGRERSDMGEVEVELEHALQLQEEADSKYEPNANS
ncbi:receptor-like protein kinase FERONIA [Arachis stenosperma]|uniref:receptor-like protein kinase FERONIA n=1 Tax=Arachis stenosperma TaxID=217475 RepID=UPI0025ABDF75|nr:receptor-like protein kinase FERONIA [Arachis stenosperma]